jgi:hypothetical protein
LWAALEASEFAIARRGQGYNLMPLWAAVEANEFVIARVPHKGAGLRIN